MKCCHKCRKMMPLTSFNKDRSRWDGLQARCKSCHLEANREWSKKHPERRRAAMRRRYIRETEGGGSRETKVSADYKRRAKGIVHRAIKQGRITRSTESLSWSRPRWTDIRMTTAHPNMGRG